MKTGTYKVNRGCVRWSDNDRFFFPFTYARDTRGYRPLAMVVRSGDDDERPGCSVRLSGFGHTLIMRLPPIIKPWKQKVFPASWDAETVARLGRNWYYDCHEREYGFSYGEGFLQVFLGRQTHDSTTTQDWCAHLPWTQWRHVRHSLYDAYGEHFWTKVEGRTREERMAEWDALSKAEQDCPSLTFAFADFDGEQLTATTRIDEREWHFGTGWFRWLSAFRKPMIKRGLDIRFSGETGARKGSWKGGTVGHSINMTAGELHESAFRRYCAEHQMTFIGSDP